jgi:hypothetical protein
MKRLLIALAIAGQLSACANSTTVESLHHAQADCAAGNADRCADAKTWEQMASEERKENAGKVALAVVAIPLLAGLVVLGAAAASQPTYVSKTTCSSWGNSSSCTTKAW